MGVSGVGDGNQEYNRYMRSLQAREEAHGKELEHLEKQQEQAFKEINSSTQKNVQDIEKRSVEDRAKLIDAHQKQVQDIADRFERQSQLDRKDYYDRFGRAQRDSAQELRHGEEQHKTLVDGMISSHNQETEGLRKAQADELRDSRRQSNFDRQRLTDQAEDRITTQATGFQNQLSELNRKHLDEMNRQARKNFEDGRDQKNLDNQRLENASNEHKLAEEKIRNAFQQREHELIEEKTRREDILSRQGVSSLDTYRDRLTDDLKKVMADNAYENAQRDIKFGSDISKMTHEAKQKQQYEKSAFERRLSDEKGRAEAARDRDLLQEEVRRREQAHENFLNREGIKNYYEDAIQLMKDNQAANVQKVTDDSNSNFDQLKRQFQKRLSKIDGDLVLEAQERAQKNQDSGHQEKTEHLRLRGQIIQDYETKIRALNAKNQEQNDTTESNFHQKSIAMYKENDEKLSKAHQDNQMRLSNQKTFYESVNKQQKSEADMNLSLRNQETEGQIKRATTNYHETLIDVAKNHEMQTEALKRDFAEYMAKTRAEDDTKLKDVSNEYEFRIRSMASDYESRIATMKQDHDREVNQLKADSIREKRDLQARAKADLEASMETSKKNLAIQESQFKEKSRLNEENHKTEIAKLRHSNELLSKKS